MILGIGTDVIEIKRFETLVDNHSFMQKYFTQNEIDFFKQRKNRANMVAGTFCVKEAVSKAFGTGFVGFSPIDIEVLRLETGKPYVNLHGEAYNLGLDINLKKIHVSISHSDIMAIAFVVFEGES